MSTDFAEYSQVSSRVPKFQSFFIFLHHFVLANLATSSIRVNPDAAGGLIASYKMVQNT